MAHYECKYCDRTAGYMGIPITVEDTKVCVCGAEWEDAKILVEDDDIDSNENLELLPCGCFEDHGCNCHEYEDLDTLPCGCSTEFGCECGEEDSGDNEEDNEVTMEEIIIPRVVGEFIFSVLEEHGYEYDIMEAGYISFNKATIVVEDRFPYAGQVLQYRGDLSEAHTENIKILNDLGYLSIK